VSEQSSLGAPRREFASLKVYCPSALEKIGEGEILPGKSKDSLRGGFTRFPQASFKGGWVLEGSQKTQPYRQQMGGLENDARSIDG